VRICPSRSFAVLTAILIAGSALLLSGPSGDAHSGGAIDSEWASVVPTIDGAIAPGEWADAASVDLGAIPGNRLPAHLLVKNNASRLWLAYDAVGDTTSDSNDSASFALDTGHDGVGTNGAEDQFALLGTLTAHFVFQAGSWTLHDAPFDTSLPGHAGLLGSMGFGPSDRSATNHRIFEFQVPAGLIGADPGDTLGLFGGSQPVPGVVDIRTFAYSTWPDFVGGPIPLGQYGDLTLDTPPGPVGVSVSPASARRVGDRNETVQHNLTVRNKGTSGGDTFDLTYVSAWPASLWDASGTVPLGDTDADGVPDTGNVSSGGSVPILVKVSVPASASGCSSALVTAASSRNTSVVDSSNLTTCTAPARFRPPHSDVGVDTDVPPNGFFDLLSLIAIVDVSIAGTYVMEGTLFDGSGSVVIDRAVGFYSVGPGIEALGLSFSGRAIFASGLNGPYQARLVLYDYATFEVVDNDTHTTNPYGATDFDPPAAAFDPPHRDFGRDVDSPLNGLYDELVVEVAVRVNLAGDFDISAGLYDSLGRFVTSTSRRTSLAPGTATVEVAFSGTLINQARLDGPYDVRLFLYDALVFEFLDSDTHVTAAYRAAEFDPPPVAFAPPHSDFGLDADVPPDALYDWLVVRASLSIAEAGTFIVGGTLLDRFGRYVATAARFAELVPGARTVDLRFPGPVIAAQGAEGPYTVFLSAGKFEDLNSTAFDAHFTRSYLATEFAPASASFLGPHSDRAVESDAPADGLFDWLIVDVGIDVARAGEFEVDAHLGAADGTVIGTGKNRTSLPLGRSVVSVAIDGHDIRDGGVSGPYLVSLHLYDRHGALIDQDSHVSHGHNASDFEPADRVPPDSTAALRGGYWWNSATVTVDYTATDSTPSDGLASVTLYARFSADNTTWSDWAAHDAKAVSGRSSSGSFAFAAPRGNGYYEFATVAIDAAGNTERTPLAAEARAAVFVPARLEILAASATLPAGAQASLLVRVVDADGRPALLSQSLTVSLFSDSPSGEFRSPGSTVRIRSVTIAAGNSTAPFDYVDARAGTSILTAAAERVAPGSITMSVTGIAISLSPDFAAGLGGGVAAGVLAGGIAIGWLLPRWRKRREPPAPPPPPETMP